jgi:hypothetical protein
MYLFQFDVKLTVSLVPMLSEWQTIKDENKNKTIYRALGKSLHAMASII